MEMSSIVTNSYTLSRQIGNQVQYLAFETSKAGLRTGGTAFSPPLVITQNVGVGWVPEDRVNLDTNSFVAGLVYPVTFTSKGRRGNSTLWGVTLPFSFNTTVKADVPDDPEVTVQPVNSKIIFLRSGSQDVFYLTASNEPSPDDFITDDARYVLSENPNGLSITFNTNNIIDNELISATFGGTAMLLNFRRFMPDVSGSRPWGEVFSNCSSQVYTYNCPSSNSCQGKLCIGPVDPTPGDSTDDDTDSDTDDEEDPVSAEEESNLVLWIVIAIVVFVLAIVLGLVLFSGDDDED